MANVFAGKAQVSGSVATLTVASVGLFPWQESMKLASEFEMDVIQDPSGGDGAWRTRNEKYVGDLGMIFVDQSSTSTLAHAEAGAAILAPLTQVVITGCQVAAWNATWCIISGNTIDLINTGTGKGVFRLQRYTDSAQQTLFTTNVSPD